MKIYLSIPLLLFTTLSMAQPLPKLLDSLAQRNPELRALDTEYRAARQVAPQVSQLPNPELGVGVFPFPVETRLGPQRARLSATQAFPWFGTLAARADLADAQAGIRSEAVAIRQRELATELKQAYFQLYEVARQRAIIQRRLDLLAALERVVLSRVSSGQASAAEAILIQRQREAWEQELALLRPAALPHRATINQLLNRPPDRDIALADTLAFAEWPYDRATLLATIGQDHPLIRQFARRQEAARRALTVNERAGQPSFALGLDYILVDSRNDAAPAGNGRDIVQLRAGINLPLSRGAYTAKAQEEQLKIQAWEERATALRNQFASAVTAAYARHERARLNLESYERQIELTRSARDILVAEYRTGGGNFTELLRLERELIDYDRQRLAAIVESHLARTQIEALTGA